MADQKISQLTAKNTVDATDELVMASGGTTKKVTGATLKKSLMVSASKISAYTFLK